MSKCTTNATACTAARRLTSLYAACTLNLIKRLRCPIAIVTTSDSSQEELAEALGRFLAELKSTRRSSLRTRQIFSMVCLESYELLNKSMGFVTSLVCLGVPILPQPAGIKRQINRKEESSVWDSQIGFALGLCWDLEDRSTWLRRHPAPSDRRTLICWDLNDQSTWQRRNPGPSDRRVGFPSWSWTGWFGLANWENTDKDTVWIDAGFRVKFELCDGQVIEWPTFHASYDKFSDCSAISQYIIISAWTTRVTFLGHRRWNTRDANSTFCVARIELEDGGYLLWEFSATTKEKFSPDKENLGIHLVDHEPDPDSKTIIFRGPALLVVSKVEDRMERVGFGWVTDSKYEVYGADWEQDSVDSDSMLRWSEDRPRMVKVWQEIRLG
jgi:hypothetical protein